MSACHIEIWRENIIVYGVGKGTSNIMPRVMKIVRKNSKVVNYNCYKK